MKKEYIQPELDVVEVKLQGIIATSLGSGDDIVEGDDIPAEAPGRRGMWGWME